MSNIIPIDQAAARAPALMRQRMAAGRTVNSNFSDGIRDAFPVLSIKGKVFRARISGQETPFIDPQTRQPIPYLDVVLVNASRTLAKTYYIKGFTEGDMNPPDCWSLDSIRPDPSVANKVNPTCGNCPMNAFGSKITEDGKAAKACQDARRVAVVMPHQLGEAQPMVLMLRVAQTSLKNLKAYAQLLERHGFEPGGCITRLAFDYQMAYPKLLFNFVAPLDDAQYSKVVDLAEGDMVAAMLAAPDFDNAPTTEPKQDEGAMHTGMGGLAAQQPPVLDIDGSTGPASQAAYVASQQAATPNPPQGPAMATPTDGNTIITLPDGKKFNTATMQYVEEKAPEPVLDPNVMALPDGKFYNKSTNAYVDSPYVGGASFPSPQEKLGPAPSPATAEPPKRRRRTREEMEAARAAEAAKTEMAERRAAAGPGQALGEQPSTTPAQQGPVEAQQPVANGDASENMKPVVSAASLDLQEMLAKLVPTTTQ